jgi:hypothetical protein
MKPTEENNHPKSDDGFKPFPKGVKNPAGTFFAPAQQERDRLADEEYGESPRGLDNQFKLHWKSGFDAAMKIAGTTRELAGNSPGTGVQREEWEKMLIEFCLQEYGAGSDKMRLFRPETVGMLQVACGKGFKEALTRIAEPLAAELTALKERERGLVEKLKDEAFFVHIIEKWQHTWMDVKGTDERDRQNYFNRASKIDANMRYSLARMLTKYIAEQALSEGEKEGE